MGGRGGAVCAPSPGLCPHWTPSALLSLGWWVRELPARWKLHSLGPQAVSQGATGDSGGGPQPRPSLGWVRNEPHVRCGTGMALGYEEGRPGVS